MKLNKREIEAIASTIKSDLEEKYHTEQKKLNLKDDKTNTAKAQSIFDTLTGLSEECKRVICMSFSSYNHNKFDTKFSLEDIVKSLRTSKNKINVPRRCSEIETALIIAQIECDNLDDMIKKVTAKFMV